MSNELNREEKIEKLRSGRWWKHERGIAAKYLWALYRNIKDDIEHFEMFGKSPRNIIMNYNSYNHGLKFGFDKIEFGDYDWLKRPEFINTEEFEFKTKKEKNVCSNKVEIGSGNNGKWTYGVWYSYGHGGGVSGISVFGEVFNTKQEALISGINDLIRRHKKAENTHNHNDSEPSFKSDYSKAIVAQAKDLLDKFTGVKPVQINLFDL